MLLLEVDGKGVSMESSVFLFMLNRNKKNKEFFALILTQQHVYAHDSK